MLGKVLQQEGDAFIWASPAGLSLFSSDSVHIVGPFFFENFTSKMTFSSYSTCKGATKVFSWQSLKTERLSLLFIFFKHLSKMEIDLSVKQQFLLD